MRRLWPGLLLLAACAAEERLVGLRPVPTTSPDELRWVPVRGVDQVVYDVRVVDVKARRIVYRRDGLVESRHRVQALLLPRENFRWTVRARYRRDGHPRCTAWTAPEEVDRDGETGPDRLPGGIPCQNASPTPTSK